jgi:hypothetical protein
MFCFSRPEVIGLCTVSGNVNESQAFENTQRVLDVAERRVSKMSIQCFICIYKVIATIAQQNDLLGSVTCIQFRQRLLFKHDIIFYLENKYNFRAKMFLYY